MTLNDNTPLSNAIIAGRTAWQSFHKGGNYEVPTDSISEEDTSFALRLFRKLKHLSVAEHLWYSFECENLSEILEFQRLNDGYVLIDNHIASVNGRWILEHFNDADYKELITKILDIIPSSHKAIFNEDEKETYITKDVITKDYEFKSIFGNYCDLLYKNEIFYTFRIKNISRALLQEFVRHDDFLGITVKSTRYTLKELKNEDPFITYKDNEKIYDIQRAEKYVILTEIVEINHSIIEALENLRNLIKSGFENDKTKYAIPEAYKTEMIVTLPKRNFENLIKLRTDKSALWEFQRLANEMKKLSKIE